MTVKISAILSFKEDIFLFFEETFRVVLEKATEVLSFFVLPCFKISFVDVLLKMSISKCSRCHLDLMHL